MTQLAFTTRDSDGLCRSVTLRTGHVLTRDDQDLSRWLCDEAGTGLAQGLAALIRRLTRVPAIAAAYGNPGAPRPAEREILGDLRDAHGLRFLWTFCIQGDSVLVYDELDDPVGGRYRFALEGGSHMPLVLEDRHPGLARWFGLGPEPQAFRRAYEAAAIAVHALNLGLGTRHNTLAAEGGQPALGPRLPWRVLETEDQIFINDAYDVEIMSLRTAACRPLQPVSSAARSAADLLVRSVNALGSTGPETR